MRASSFAPADPATAPWGKTRPTVGYRPSRDAENGSLTSGAALRRSLLALRQRVISHFVEQGITTLTSSLDRLAQLLETTPEDAREAVLVLLDEGDFSANCDVARLEPDHAFNLTVDWDAFNATRIGVRLRDPGQESD